MLRILQETEKGLSIEEASLLVNKEYSVDPDQDLNKLNDEELNKKKKVSSKQLRKMFKRAYFNSQNMVL